MARIGTCEFKEYGCDDPRCKVTFCFEAHEEKRLHAIHVAEVDREAEIIARDHCRNKWVSPAHIQELAAHSTIRALAITRLKALKYKSREQRGDVPPDVEKGEQALLALSR